MLPEDRFINRELSWLEFNQRVLDEAHDPQVPLLERLRFLSISASNLDEFFMVRVGSLTLLAERSHTHRDPSGKTPAEQLEAIGERVDKIVRDQYETLRTLEEQLEQIGIRRLKPDELSDRQTERVEKLFSNEISAVLSPMAIHPEDEFPLLINQTLNVCVRLRNNSQDEARYAVIPFGRRSARFLTLPAERGYSYILLEDVVSLFVERFFPGEEILECTAFRITRNADLDLQEDSASDLLAEMQEMLDARKLGDCVRLETCQEASPEMIGFLTSALRASPEVVYPYAGPLDLASFFQLSEIAGFESHRYDSWPPQPSPDIDPTRSMFETLAERDILLYHPYESFEPVVRLIEEAAIDEDVLAIKITLYRTSRKSPIVAALKRAAENGKYVTALVELKARFDEARNIGWAKSLEQSGVQVIYGVRGLKTHSKICVIVRREPQGVQRYVHFGTGNYNEATARIYSDASYMTCDEHLGADATTFFNSITGNSQPMPFRKIEAAPLGLRERLLEMIETETQRKLQGQRAAIVAKLNSLVDPVIIDRLYEASQAGVSVRLNIRGICCLCPGVPGLSDNITVISIVDRFLEHARILYFYHGGDERVFISSADWMPRNLDRRVELLVPIESLACKHRLIDILESYFKDTVKARRILPSGSYEKRHPAAEEPLYRSQQQLYERIVADVRQSQQARRTNFEPHRAPKATD